MGFMQPDTRIATAAAGPDGAANGAERGLVREAGTPRETDGPRWVFTAPDLDLDRYVGEFNGSVLTEYGRGRDGHLAADSGMARSLIPPATGRFRDFSYVSPELPRFLPEQCVACMECVTLCPDTAILAKLAEPEEVAACANTIGPKDEREGFLASWIRTTKFHDVFEKKGERGGLFAIHVDPTKCKGCGECVEVCGSHHALVMEPKTDALLESYRAQTRRVRALPEPPARLLAKRLPVDAMLQERALLYVGGAGSCAGCGEATAIRMMLAATGAEYGAEEIGIVAATGCNTVYASTYPYN
ncbi:MAG: 4Fe-4S binding protein, partial [SAR324 cluster bacterium]